MNEEERRRLLYRQASGWNSPHLHLTLVLLKALKHDAPPNAWTRLVNTRHSRCADPSIVVKVARRWRSPHLRAQMTYRERTVNNSPFARAFVRDYHHRRWNHLGASIYESICASMWVMIDLGVTGKHKEALLEQHGASGLPVLRFVYGFGTRALRRNYLRRYTQDIVRKYINPMCRRYSTGYTVIENLLWFITTWDTGRLFFSEQQIFDLFFDMVASVKPLRRRKFLGWLASRIKSRYDSCTLIATMAKLRQALKNDIGRLSFEQIDAVFV